MNIDMIGVPVDLGANRRGVDMGPSAIRYAGLEKSIRKLKHNLRDLGNLDVRVRESIDDNDTSNMKYINEITRVNRELANMVSDIISAGRLPLVLGGDHCIAVGTILGTQYVLKNIGVLWIDAHGDFNTESTTLSGNLHGMSLAASSGSGAKEMTSFKPQDVEYIKPEKIALVAVRDIDDEEAELIKKSGIHIFTMSDIDMYGMREVMKRALEVVQSGTNGFHLSFDMDAISPYEAPGVGTPVNGGLTYREAHLAAEMISDSRMLSSVEFVEVNPVLDHGNKTGTLAVSLICSVLGKKII